MLFIDEHVDERAKEAYVSRLYEFIYLQLLYFSTFRVI